MVEPHSSKFRVITTNFLGVRIFRKFTVITLSAALAVSYNKVLLVLTYYPVEQIKWVFGDNLGIIFNISPYKHMLWVLKPILMSTHNICFYGELTKNDLLIITNYSLNLLPCFLPQYLAILAVQSPHSNYPQNFQVLCNCL